MRHFLIIVPKRDRRTLQFWQMVPTEAFNEFPAGTWNNTYSINVPDDAEDFSPEQYVNYILLAEQILHSDQTEFLPVVVLRVSDDGPATIETETHFYVPRNNEYVRGLRPATMPDRFHSVQMGTNRALGRVEKHTYFDAVDLVDILPGFKSLKINRDGGLEASRYPMYRAVIEQLPYLDSVTRFDKQGWGRPLAERRSGMMLCPISNQNAARIKNRRKDRETNILETEALGLLVFAGEMLNEYQRQFFLFNWRWSDGYVPLNQSVYAMLWDLVGVWFGLGKRIGYLPEQDWGRPGEWVQDGPPWYGWHRDQRYPTGHNYNVNPGEIQNIRLVEGEDILKGAIERLFQMDAALQAVFTLESPDQNERALWGEFHSAPWTPRVGIIGTNAFNKFHTVNPMFFEATRLISLIYSCVVSRKVLRPSDQYKSIDPGDRNVWNYVKAPSSIPDVTYVPTYREVWDMPIEPNLQLSTAATATVSVYVPPAPPMPEPIEHKSAMELWLEAHEIKDTSTHEKVCHVLFIIKTARDMADFPEWLFANFLKWVIGLFGMDWILDYVSYDTKGKLSIDWAGIALNHYCGDTEWH